MSEENVETVKQVAAAFAEKGVEGTVPFFTDDIVIYSIPEWPDDSEYRGHDGLRRLARQWTENFDDFGLDLHELHDGGETVVALYELIGQTKRLRDPHANADRRRLFGVQWRTGRTTASLLQLGSRPRSRRAAGVGDVAGQHGAVPAGHRRVQPS